jgi:hypothetical protein
MSLSETISTLGVIVAAAAALYAYKAPIRAAEHADRLRAEADQREKERRIFEVLMSERGKWGSSALISALNAVKVTFKDDKEVIDSWYRFYSALLNGEFANPFFFDMLAKICARVGLDLRREDLENYIVNSVQSKAESLWTLQVETAFSQLTASGTRPLPNHLTRPHRPRILPLNRPLQPLQRALG